jgi:hypothetical protein
VTEGLWKWGDGDQRYKVSIKQNKAFLFIYFVFFSSLFILNSTAHLLFKW